MTHNDLVEKLALAISKAPSSTCASRAKARAAIAVIAEMVKEPSLEMERAGAFLGREIPLGNGQTATGFALGDQPRFVWKKMLAASPTAPDMKNGEGA